MGVKICTSFHIDINEGGAVIYEAEGIEADMSMCKNVVLFVIV